MESISNAGISIETLFWNNKSVQTLFFRLNWNEKKKHRGSFFIENTTIFNRLFNVSKSTKILSLK